VAELADALDLGSSGRKAMGVRPSPFAPRSLPTPLCATIAPKPGSEIPKPQSPDAPIEVFTPEQMRALLDAAEPSILEDYASHGFKTCTCAAVKPLALRDTTVKLW
jgi:hypothetical protein